MLAAAIPASPPRLYTSSSTCLPTTIWLKCCELGECGAPAILESIAAPAFYINCDVIYEYIGDLIKQLFEVPINEFKKEYCGYLKCVISREGAAAIRPTMAQVVGIEGGSSDGRQRTCVCSGFLQGATAKFDALPSDGVESHPGDKGENGAVEVVERDGD